MTDASSAPNPPRLLTGRSIAITVIVLALALVMAWASVVLRRTRLEKTREFLGSDAIHAIQSGPIVFMEFRDSIESGKISQPIEPSETASSESMSEPELSKLPPNVPPDAIELSGTPGLGMLRRGLLDERHYLWDTLREGSIADITDENLEFVVLYFSDDPQFIPPENARADVVPTSLMLELSQGWVEIPGQRTMVRLTERARPAIRNFVVTRKNIRSSPSK